MNDLNQILNDCLHEFEFNQIEIGPLQQPMSFEFYEKWIQNNYFGSMKYLKAHLSLKKNPQLLNSQVTSVITIAQSYFPAVKPIENPARIAMYAQNEDYHHWLKEKLQSVIEKLQAQFPHEIYLPYVDSGPVLERNWAYQNGMGWFGKNSCLIHPKHGSLFFIAEILTSLNSTVPMNIEPLPDFCGTCQKCMTICPTEALIAPKILKADQCISYLTIEAKEVPSIDLRTKIGDWFFGCDLCQTTCPWNEKLFKQKKLSSQPSLQTDLLLEMTSEEKNKLISYLSWLLNSSNNQIQKQNKGTALARASGKNLKRNALIVIANRQLTELKNDVENLKIPELTELKEWTLQKIT